MLFIYVDSIYRFQNVPNLYRIQFTQPIILILFKTRQVYLITMLCLLIYCTQVYNFKFCTKKNYVLNEICILYIIKIPIIYLIRFDLSCVQIVIIMVLFEDYRRDHRKLEYMKKHLPCVNQFMMDGFSFTAFFISLLKCVLKIHRIFYQSNNFSINLKIKYCN